MMHGRGESDSAIVAGKPTNKAERSAAEPVEPRAEAKGNASQQSTGRTQSRGTVSQALERIRQAARQRKKEKFTALLHHISIDLLDEAFFELKQDAAPGVDGLTWTDYEQNLERNLEDLHARIHRGAYRALPSRRTYHTQAGWPAAPARDCRPGGQDRPTGDCCGAQRDLRGRLPRVLVLDSDPGAARTTRWMRSLSGSRARR